MRNGIATSGFAVESRLSVPMRNKDVALCMFVCVFAERGVVWQRSPFRDCIVPPCYLFYGPKSLSFTGRFWFWFSPTFRSFFNGKEGTRRKTREIKLDQSRNSICRHLRAVAEWSLLKTPFPFVFLFFFVFFASSHLSWEVPLASVSVVAWTWTGHQT